MNSVQFWLENVKCSGCVNAVRNKVLSFQGVKEVKVDLDSKLVEIQFEGELNLEDIKQSLKAMGYPERQMV